MATRTLLEQMSQLCMSAEFADVMLIVGEEEQRIPSHRIILVRNEYFYNLFHHIEATQHEDQVEQQTQQKQEVIVDIPTEHMKILLHYLYTNETILPGTWETKCGDLFDFLITAKKYLFDDVKHKLVKRLCENLGLVKMRNKHVCQKQFEELCYVLNGAYYHKVDDIYNKCLEFIDSNAYEFLKYEAALQKLNLTLFMGILKRDTFDVSEILIYEAVQKYCKNKPDTNRRTINSCIRFTLMTNEQISNILQTVVGANDDDGVDVDEFGLVDEIDLQKRDLIYNNNSIVPFRFTPDENFASTDFNAYVWNKNGRVPLLPNSVLVSKCYDNRFNNNFEQILIDLNVPRVINTISFMLKVDPLYTIFTSKQLSSLKFSYTIETSIDCKTWKRVADYSKYVCVNKQEIYFDKHCARYIRFADRLRLGNLEIMYKSRVPKNINGIVVPRSNVFQLMSDKGTYIAGASQPYCIESMRMHFDAPPTLFHFFFPEYSTNFMDWQIMENVTQRNAGSWIYLFFDSCIACYIRIQYTTYGSIKVLEAPAMLKPMPVFDF